MSRSSKKGPYVDMKLLGKVEKQEAEGRNEPIKTWSRACMIHPLFVGRTFLVHNGRAFINVYVTDEMVGHRLGEFALTRTFKGHGARGKK